MNDLKKKDNSTNSKVTLIQKVSLMYHRKIRNLENHLVLWYYVFLSTKSHQRKIIPIFVGIYNEPHSLKIPFSNLTLFECLIGSRHCLINPHNKPVRILGLVFLRNVKLCCK